MIQRWCFVHRRPSEDLHAGRCTIATTTSGSQRFAITCCRILRHLPSSPLRSPRWPEAGNVLAPIRCFETGQYSGRLIHHKLRCCQPLQETRRGGAISRLGAAVDDEGQVCFIGCAGHGSQLDWIFLLRSRRTLPFAGLEQAVSPAQKLGRRGAFRSRRALWIKTHQFHPAVDAGQTILVRRFLLEPALGRRKSLFDTSKQRALFGAAFVSPGRPANGVDRRWLPFCRRFPAATQDLL